MGYYTIANKLIRYIISFITIIGAIMLPRLSYLYINDKDKYIFYLKKCFSIIMMLALPFSIYFYIFSSNIIDLIGGDVFKPAIVTMRILSPLCIIVSVAYFFAFLILYPQNLEKIYTNATILSAIFSVMINFVAIKHFQQNGAAIVAVLSELLAIIIMFFYITTKKLLDGFYDKNLMKILAINVLLFFTFFTLSIFYSKINDMKIFMLFSVLFFIQYFIMMYISKENNTREIINQIFLRKIKK